MVLKLIISFLLGILLIIYYLIDVDNIFFYINIGITIFSIIIAVTFLLFINYYNVLKKYLYKITPKINIFIDKYGIYILLISVFIYLNYITFSKHLNFYSSGFDLGIFDQVIYKYSNFQFPASSSIRMISNIEADHFHPILLIYALIYKIYASPLILLLIQNFFFILGGLGIYKIAKFKLNIPVIGFFLVFLYLIFKGNINALLFDFHPMVIAVSLFPWLFYFSIKKQRFYFYILVIPILLSKENLSIYIIFFGIYQFFIQKDRYIGLITFIIGGLYFYLVMNYFIPAMGGVSRYWSYDALGNNPKELIFNTLLHPFTFLSILFSSLTKIITYMHHLGSGLYVAILSPVIIFLIPAYAQKFLSSREEFWTMNFHYSIDIYWVIAIGIIFAFYGIRKKYPQKYIDIFIILGVFIFTNSFLINIYKSPLLYYNYHLENKETLDEIISGLPDNIKLSTQNNIISHFSHNNDVFIFPNLGNSEYILLNRKIDSGWPLSNDKNLDYYINILKNKEDFINIKLPFIRNSLNFTRKYEIIVEKDEIYLFKLVSK